MTDELILDGRRLESINAKIARRSEELFHMGLLGDIADLLTMSRAALNCSTPEDNGWMPIEGLYSAIQDILIYLDGKSPTGELNHFDLCLIKVLKAAERSLPK